MHMVRLVIFYVLYYVDKMFKITFAQIESRAGSEPKLSLHQNICSWVIHHHQNRRILMKANGHSDVVALPSSYLS